MLEGEAGSTLDGKERIWDGKCYSKLCVNLYVV